MVRALGEPPDPTIPVFLLPRPPAPGPGPGALARDHARLLAALQASNRLLGRLLPPTGDKKNAAESTNGEAKPNKKDKKGEGGKKADGRNGTESSHSLHNLSHQLDVAEEAQVQLSQDLQRTTREKLEVQNQLAVVREEQEQLRGAVEQLTKEKWELGAVNTDLQQRLQQTVTLAHMQAEGNQSRLQEEVGRMMFQLEEERKVTANLSRGLELEKRKVESLEQKAKGGSAGRGSGGSRGERRRSSLLPEDVREGEARLAHSIELYRQRCDNLGVSLEGVQARLEDEGWRGDLGTEVNKLRKLLAEEKRKAHGETTKLAETSQLFEQVYLDYAAAMDCMRQAAQQEKRQKSQQGGALGNIAESELAARLERAEAALAAERAAARAATERLERQELELEAVPLLRAQVEVYQSDFNAERTARERIAGEKAELEEQVRKGAAGRAPSHGPPGGHRDQGRAAAGREAAQYDNIPRTVNTRPDPPGPEPEGPAAEAFTCPKCNKEFRNMTLLTRHVNDCLDRDF